MLESRWPKGPIITLVLLVPALFILNPYIRATIRSLKAAGAEAQTVPPQLAPQNQGGYVLANLDSLANAYWRRVAGTDSNQPPHVNGHDEFAAAWLNTMKHNLRGLDAGVLSQRFPVPGFTNARATEPGRNIIVFVPGSTHPHRAVIIAAHYDGEPDSHGSAFDDTSGSAIILGLARALGAYWRANGHPSLTVEFVLFDAEEQGLIGSGAYLYFLRHGAILPRPVMMLDQEQSGVGYPVRPFGLASSASMPAFAITTVQSAFVKRLFHPLIRPSQASLAAMSRRLTADRSATFSALRTVYPSLPLRGGSVAAFSKAEEDQLVVGPTPVCCSDNAPFEALGLPTATFSGDFHFYYQNRPDWAYPYDQPQDTPAALACDTGGSPTPSKALRAALTVPVEMSYQLVNQYAPAVSKSLHRFTVLGGRVVAGRRAELSAAGPGPIHWSFGDGARATGATVFHRYASPGDYILRVTSARARSAVRVSVAATVKLPHDWSNTPKEPPIRPWHPSELKGVNGCP